MKRVGRIGKLVLLFSGWLLLTSNAFVFNNSTGWSLFLFFSGFLLVTVLACLPSLKRVQLETAKVHYGQVGKSVSFPLQMKARWFWTPLLQVSLGKEDENAQQLLFYHGQELHLTFDKKLKQRGRFDELSLKLQGSDLFGLVLKEQTRRLASTLYVLPAEDEAGKKFGQQLQQQLTKRLFGEVLPQVKGYREYRPGDNRRQVDWKVSARQRTLTIREQEVGQVERPVLVFWGQQGPDFEKALSRYYSLQKELGPGLSQYLLGQQTQLLEDERGFAELSGFNEPPATPAWRNQDLWVFYPHENKQLQQKVAHWRRQNRVFLYPLLESGMQGNPATSFGKQVSS